MRKGLAYYKCCDSQNEKLIAASPKKREDFDFEIRPRLMYARQFGEALKLCALLTR
jgi:hypothetical protein